jgi:hypothetical protein
MKAFIHPSNDKLTFAVVCLADAFAVGTRSETDLSSVSLTFTDLRSANGPNSGALDSEHALTEASLTPMIQEPSISPHIHRSGCANF